MLKFKSLVLLFLCLTAGVAVVLGGSSKKAARSSSTLEADAAEQRQILVTYFHGNFRCMSCKKIEAYAEEAVRSNFKEEMKNKTLDYRVVNVEEKGNEHFVKEYELFTKSVVVSDMVNGQQVRWKNLSKVWELLSDKEAFQSYIRDEIKAYQEARPAAPNEEAAKKSGKRPAQ